ncbi:nuclear transport factor 2 family protein [Nocardia sp. NPDC004568]|uniref:nuclear transport factor 2 family protein n=1 Tax=Nocardia sp. NPDC004568 TaxID=3154551 RepID=UPI0033BD23C8
MSTDGSIADRIEIADLFTRFARLLDEGRYGDAATVYTDDVTVHSPRGGTLRGIDAVADFIRRSAVDGEYSQHTATDLLVEVSGDRAAASANSLVHYYRAGRPPHRTGGLRLTSTVIRTPAGRRLGELRIAPAWIREE